MPAGDQGQPEPRAASYSATFHSAVWQVRGEEALKWN